MLKPKGRPKRDKPEEELDDDASKNGDGQVLALLNQIVAKQQEQDERMSEIETKGLRGAAQLRLTELLYDTDDEHLPGLTVLPLRAIKPFAIAMTLDDITNKDVRSGKVSLQHRFRMHYFNLMRSCSGIHLSKGRELAGEQVATEKDTGGEIRELP